MRERGVRGHVGVWGGILLFSPTIRAGSGGGRGGTHRNTHRNVHANVAPTLQRSAPLKVPEKRGHFAENGENDEFAFYPLKTRVSLLKPRKTTKMTKMAGVTQAKAWFRKEAGLVLPGLFRLLQIAFRSFSLGLSGSDKGVLGQSEWKIIEENERARRTIVHVSSCMFGLLLLVFVRFSPKFCRVLWWIRYISWL